MLIRTIAAALTLVLLACFLPAQEYTGFPGSRVRQVRQDSIPPDELYPQNRVIIRKTDLTLVGNGMQITGEVVTDFDADRVPPEKNTLPKGQLTGLKVNVELYYWDTVFERDPKTGKVSMPQVDVRRPGMLVEGQSVTVTINEQFERFGLAKFSLPALTKPLAPGVYRLVATVNFKIQDNKLVEAIKWCSDLYGARPEYDEDTMEVTFKNVMANADLHEEVYQFLVRDMGGLKDETLLWIGEVYKDGNLSLIPAEKGTDKAPANYVIWSYHLNVVGQLMDFQNQLDNVDAVIDAELALKLKSELKKDATEAEKAAHEERKKKWKEQAEDDKRRIRRDNGALIAKYGGRTSKDEDKRYVSAVAARLLVLDQVGKLHEYLARRYWVLTDGYLKYAGWYHVNQAGYNASDAIAKNDNKAKSAERRQKDDPQGRSAKWTARQEKWKFVPPDMYTYAAAYLKAEEESDIYDAEKFTAKVGGKIELDTGKWADFRAKFVLDFYEKSNTMIKQVTTTEVYAVQVWPQALSQLISARDDVIALTYAWEYYIRKEQMGETVEVIQDGWKREAQTTAAVPLSDYFARAKANPGTIKTRFDGSFAAIKSAAKIGDFMSAYSKAVQAQGDKPDSRYLPGVRPPSAPTKEEK